MRRSLAPWRTSALVDCAAAILIIYDTEAEDMK